MSGAQLAGSLSHSGMSMQNLTKFSENVYSGHYHLRKDYEFKDGTVSVVGNPFQMDFGDYGNDKGVYILNVDSGKRKFIPNNISPIFMKLHWSNMPADLSSVKGNYTKLIVDAEC